MEFQQKENGGYLKKNLFEDQQREFHHPVFVCFSVCLSVYHTLYLQVHFRSGWITYYIVQAAVLAD